MISFIVITAIIIIKYEPKYGVLINNKTVGYINSQKDIDKYIEETVEAECNKNIAFIDLKSTPILKLELVNRNLENQEETVKNEIAKDLSIEYTTYAIAINGKNKTYVDNKETAQEIVDEVKKEYSEKNTDKIGIIQEYSDDYKSISAVSKKEAKNILAKEIKNEKKTDHIKVAKSKKEKTQKATKLSKVVDANGIKFSTKPVTGILTSRYGRRSSPGGIGSTNHKGLDIAAKSGTPIYAVSGGTVIFAGYKGSLGNLVIIDHGNGVQTYYGHCSKLLVSKGNKVSSGDNISLVGRTGAATGYHLHFEVHIKGATVNPQNYIYK